MKIQQISICIIVMMIFAGNTLKGQSKALKIGDKVPDILLHDFLMSDRTSMKLSELKGKLVILDFWSTHCIPCVQAMPKMDALQKKYKDQIRIFPVTSLRSGKEYKESKSAIEAFWKKNSYTNRTSLTTIVDTTLAAYFPSNGALPYEVWINGEGILVGLTTIVNEQQIRSVLKGNLVDPMLNDIVKRFAYDHSRNLLILDHSQPTSPKQAWYTSITTGIPGDISNNPTVPSFVQDTIQNTTRLRFLNVDISGLYQRTLWHRYGAKSLPAHYKNLNRWIWNVNNRLRYEFIPNSYEKESQATERLRYLHENSYCYDAIMPGLRTKEDMAERMKQDLDIFFYLDTKLEKQMTDCWVLIRTSKDDKLLFSNKKDNWGADSVRQGRKNALPVVSEGKVRYYDEPGYRYFRTDIDKLTKVEKNIGYLISDIKHQTHLPILNETGIEMPVAIAIDVVFDEGEPQEDLTYAPDKINPQLKRYGLELVKAKREMEVFVITEKDYKNEKRSK